MVLSSGVGSINLLACRLTKRANEFKVFVDGYQWDWTSWSMVDGFGITVVVPAEHRVLPAGHNAAIIIVVFASLCDGN